MAFTFDEREQVCVPKWEENDQLPEAEQISCEFKTMTWKDVVKMRQENVSKIDVDKIKEEGDTDAVLFLWTQIEYVVANYTYNYKNIFESDGTAITEAQPLLDRFGPKQFALFAEIFNHVFQASDLSGEEEKNLDSDSAQKPSESDMIAEAV